MSEYTVERPWHAGEVQRLDEQGRVLDLAATASAHEAPKLRLDGPSLLSRLLLQRAARSKLTLRFDDVFHGAGTERTDQLVLQVGDAHVETQCFHVVAGEVGTEAGPPETAPEVVLLGGVIEARQSDGKTLRPEQMKEASDVPRTSDGHHRNALRVKFSTTARSERLNRQLVADPFDKHHRTYVDIVGQRLTSVAGQSSTLSARCPLDGCTVRSPLLVHTPQLHSSPMRARGPFGQRILDRLSEAYGNRISPRA